MNMKTHFFHSAQTFLLISGVRFLAIAATLLFSTLLLHGGAVYAECEDNDDCAAGEVYVFEATGPDAGSRVRRADTTDDTNPGASGELGTADELNLPNVELDSIDGILNLLFLIAGGLATVFIVIGGARFVFASGNPEQIETAKKTVLYAVVGLVIVIFASVIVNFVIGEV